MVGKAILDAIEAVLIADGGVRVSAVAKGRDSRQAGVAGSVGRCTGRTVGLVIPRIPAVGFGVCMDDASAVLVRI